MRIKGVNQKQEIDMNPRECEPQISWVCSFTCTKTQLKSLIKFVAESLYQSSFEGKGKRFASFSIYKSNDGAQ